MKIDRQNQTDLNRRVKHSFTRGRVTSFVLAACVLLIFRTAGGQSPATAERLGEIPQKSSSTPPAVQNHASLLIDQVIDRLANGQAFDCKVRQRVQTAGREVIGVGTYLQVGGGSGQFSFQIKMLDGDGKHTLHQISDGRLAWTRSEIAGTVALSRVDVGWLDEGARTLGRESRIKPSMMVGGPSEMLDAIRRDFDLKLGKSTLDGRPLLVVIGTLKQSKRDEIDALRGKAAWPDLYPTRVNIAVAETDAADIAFGKGLPIRIEHWSDPVAVEIDSDDKKAPEVKRQMISLLEFYSIRPVAPPPIQRFRFENQDTEVDFVNETSRYEDRFDIRVTAKERARFHR
ncbi:hypothetical protein NHH03_25185 [Stieleria sp. TO1_6]|uniref:hypothetical protein n=1 Tax=Stieleria tagensis TaxID=2956795 RepID=UPI00209B43D2|nr:hypothetical protein [Stieleria tagensis]MCO8125055.1 hypothetical protein [Stieleria tagensis]